MYDVIVVGSGVAGSYISQHLKKDFDILTIDNGNDCIKDSGIVSTRIKDFVKPPITKRIKKMELISPQGNMIKLAQKKPFAYILKRREFRDNMKKGLDITKETVRTADFFDNNVHVWTDESDYSAKFLIDCSGARSKIHSQVFGPQKTVLGMFNKSEPFRGNVRVFLNKYFSPDFFSWEVPVNGEHGLITGKNIADYFSYYQKTLEFPNGYQEVHPIPMGVSESVYKRSVFVGDSCGQVKPMTGGGIVFSLTAADLALQTIKQVLEGEEGTLEQYKHSWEKVLKKEIKKQLFLRRFYKRLTNRQIERLFRTLPDEINMFDYDHLSGAARNLPASNLLKFLITLLIR